MSLLFGELVRRRHRHHVDIVLGQESVRFVICVKEAIAAESGLVDNMIGDVLCVLDRCRRVVYVLVSLTVGGVEAELDLVKTVREPEEGVVSAFNGRHNLVLLAVAELALIVRGDGNEVQQLLGSQEVAEGDAEVKLVVERHLVELLLELKAEQLVVDHRLLRQEMQVLLEGGSDELLSQRLQESINIVELRSEHGEHAPGNSDDGEVVLRLLTSVVLSCPVQNIVHCLQVLRILEA